MWWHVPTIKILGYCRYGFVHSTPSGLQMAMIYFLFIFNPSGVVNSLVKIPSPVEERVRVRSFFRLCFALSGKPVTVKPAG